MKIEWSTSLRSDGTKRRPPPNALHGWLAKMRGTLTGNEELRSRGMREMVDARRYKDTMRRHAKSTGQKGSSRSKSSSRSTRAPSQRLTKDSRSASSSSKKSHHSSTSTRPKAVHRSSQSSARTMPGAYPAPRPSTQRRNTTKR